MAVTAVTVTAAAVTRRPTAVVGVTAVTSVSLVRIAVVCRGGGEEMAVDGCGDYGGGGNREAAKAVEVVRVRAKYR